MEVRVQVKVSENCPSPHWQINEHEKFRHKPKHRGKYDGKTHHPAISPEINDELGEDHHLLPMNKIKPQLNEDFY